MKNPAWFSKEAVEESKKASKERERREKALNRIIARELEIIGEEEELENGLAKGHYLCPKCGEVRGWRVEYHKGRFSSGERPTFTVCSCGDRPYFKSVTGYVVRSR